MPVLVRPSAAELPAYVRALEAGWSPDNMRGAVAARDERAALAADTAAFLATRDDPEARGAPITMPDGSHRPRLPGFRRWIWDGDFAGSIGFRWQPGTADLPDWVPGHIGYSVVPWMRRRGLATAALAEMLDAARTRGLAHVELTAEADNPASHKVITANGGVEVERFIRPDAHGGAETIRFRIAL